jgi:hypothetical protein
VHAAAVVGGDFEEARGDVHGRAEELREEHVEEAEVVGVEGAEAETP